MNICTGSENVDNIGTRRCTQPHVIYRIRTFSTKQMAVCFNVIKSDVSDNALNYSILTVTWASQRLQAQLGFYASYNFELSKSWWKHAHFSYIRKSRLNSCFFEVSVFIHTNTKYKRSDCFASSLCHAFVIWKIMSYEFCKGMVWNCNVEKVVISGYQ